MNERTTTENRRLQRELGAPLLCIYGIGTILGAGIYVLIGKVVGEAGYRGAALALPPNLGLDTVTSDRREIA